MPIPEHRRKADKRVDPRLRLLAAFLLGALLAAGIAGVLASRSSSGSSTSGSGSTSNATPTDASGTPSPSASPIPSGKAVQRALMIKPLSQLKPGDRVIYNMTACRFRSWVGTGIDVALIACADEPEPFQARTVNLIPVEASTD